MPAVYAHDLIALVIILAVVGFAAIRQYIRACRSCRPGGPGVQRACRHCANQARHDAHSRAVMTSHNYRR